MTDIQLQNWTATTGVAPTPTYDATSGFRYESWALNNEKGGNFVVPSAVSGSAITLKFQESTPGQSLKHKWEARVTLLEPGSDPTNVDADEVFTTEFTSPATANILTNREFTITTSGQIASTTPAQGDTVNVVLKRIAASGSEDGNSIKIGPVMVEIIMGPLSTASYEGRLGQIEAGIRAQFNEQSPGNAPFLTDANILTWVNQCKNDLALENLFIRWSTMDWPTSGEIDLRTELTDLVSVFQDEGTCLRLDDADYPNGRALQWILDQAEWNDYLTDASQWSAYPYTGLIYLDRDTLFLLPTQSVEITGGINLKNSYQPIDLTGTGTVGQAGVTPPSPAPYDILYVYYGLKCAFLKEERERTRRNPMSQQYAAMYEREKARLLKKKAPRITQVTGYI